MERSNKPSAIPVSPTIAMPQVTISEDNSRVSARLPTGESIEVMLHGATVISWKSYGGSRENLFLSSKASLDGSKPVRGGIPLVFPVFGPPPQNHATSNLSQHGFARNTKWEYLGKSSSESSSLANSAGDSSVKLDFGLSTAMLGDNVPSPWRETPFGLTYSITLGKDELSTTLVVRNTGQRSFDFQTLFHTYFSTQDIHKTSVTGLEASSFIDKIQGAKEIPPAQSPISFTSELDRVYSAPLERLIAIAENGKTKLEITRDELLDVVVWNPWSAKANSMADFGPTDGWKNMVCVEAGSVNAWNTLEPGDSWEGGQRIKAC